MEKWGIVSKNQLRFVQISGMMNAQKDKNAQINAQKRNLRFPESEDGYGKAVFQAAECLGGGSDPIL